MNKLFVLAKRNFKEIIREPVSMIFCIIFPVLMLVIMQLIFTSMEVTPPNFEIENYAVGIAVFGYTFVMLSVAMLMSGDKKSEFINRLYMAPVSKWSYLGSYVICMLPFVLVQTLVFFSIALIFGLTLSWRILLAIVYMIPSGLLYIVLGVLIGTISKNEKQSGPFSSIIISMVGILGGIFMPVDNLGVFTTIVNLLPFVHSIRIASGVFSGDLGSIYPHILWVVGYTVLVGVITFMIQKFRKNK